MISVVFIDGNLGASNITSDWVFWITFSNECVFSRFYFVMFWFSDGTGPSSGMSS